MIFIYSNLSFNDWEYLTIKYNLENEKITEMPLDGPNYQNILGPWNSRNDSEFLIIAQI